MMTNEKFKNLIGSYGKQHDINVAHDHFKSPQKPPFIAYEIPSTSNVKADNRVWFKINNYDVNLYARINIENEENQLEAFFDDHEIVWDKESRIWLDDEKVYWSTYHVG